MKQFIDKLIERLEEEHERCINRYGVVGGNLPAMEVKQCMEIVNQLAEKYSNDWIPVDKTLPKKSGYYTVTEEQYSSDMRRKIGVRVSHEVQFDAEEQRWYRAKFLKVIAWKEHETPYQPKGE